MGRRFPALTAGLAAGAMLATLWAPVCALAAPVEPVVPPRVIIQQEPGSAAAWKKEWDEARDLARRERFQEAAARYEILLAREAGLHEARWELARILLRLGEPGRATVHLELLREAQPERIEYSRALAAALLGEGRFGRASDLFRRLLETAPRDPEALAGLVEALLGQEKKAEAAGWLETLLTMAPENRAHQEKLARLYLDLNQPAKALPLARKLAEPANAIRPLLVLTARIYEALGQGREALPYWRRVQALDPGDRQAAARIEAYFLSEGQGEEALAHLLPKLKSEPNNPTLLRRTGQVYVGLTRFSDALPYLERYLKHRPDDRETLRMVVDIHAALGNRAEALVTLEQLLALEGESNPDKLRQAALLYEAQGETARALSLYARILKQRPDDPEILARQGRLLTGQGRQEEALALLAQPERRRQLRQVLEKWHELEPNNREIGLRLAIMYLEAEELARSAELFAKLAQAGLARPEFFAARGLLHEGLGRPYAAWQDYEQALLAWPERLDLRLRALRLAGELGLVERVAGHRDYLAAQPAGFSFEQRLAVAAALGRSGASAAAEPILAELLPAAAEPAAESRVRREIARQRLATGLYYEAEEQLRIALNLGVKRVEILADLAELTLAAKRPEEAAIWLEYLAEADGVSRFILDALRARIWSAMGEHRAAIRLAEQLREKATTRSESRRALLLAGRVDLAADEWWGAEGVRRELAAGADSLSAELPADASDDQVEALLLEAAIKEQRGERVEAAALVAQARAWAGDDLGRILGLAGLFEEYGLDRWRPELLAHGAAKHPESLRAALLLADALATAGDFDQSLAALAELARRFPGQPAVLSRQAEFALAAGRPQEALVAAGAAANAQAAGRMRFTLLQAQALWQQRQWSAALELLSKAQEPSVAGRFAEAAGASGLNLPPAEKADFWARLLRRPTPRAALLHDLMAPEYAADAAPEQAVWRRLAAPLYADYRWQERFALEAVARQAVIRREFFNATREYERLVRFYPHDPVLRYDLAALYGIQERYEAEGELYEQLAAASLAYPGLAEAREGNRLQRRPRTAATYGYRREEGREGYKAMRLDWYELSQWLSPALGHGIEVAVSRRNYESTDEGQEKMRANRLDARYKLDLFAGVDLILGAGLTAFADGPDRLSTVAEVSGDLSDRLWGRLSFKRQLVEDTSAALQRGISANRLKAEGAVDLFPRLRAGGGLERTDYSDNNRINGYDFWAAWLIFTDPTRLTLRYTYDFKDSAEGVTVGPLLADGFAADDHPYWAPLNYWRKTFDLSFRHQLNDDPFQRDINRYYTISYALSYDSRGYAHQAWESAFSAEVSRRLLLKAGLSLHNSQEYRARSIDASLVYRW